MSSSSALRVFKAIESRILSGQFKPRERLIEMDLMDRFGASRTMIRGALKELEAKGLVRNNFYRGAVVADLTAKQVKEIYAVRAVLEKMAARLVLKNIREEEINRLITMLKELESHLRRRTQQMIAKDSEFHKAIFKTCGNQCLCDLIEFLHTKAHIVRYNAWANPQRIEQSILEHQQMIQAIQERNRVTLEKLVVNHLALSHKSYLGRQHFYNFLCQKDGKGAPVRGSRTREKMGGKIFTENLG